MTVREILEWRNGRLWCNFHEQWWKECPCEDSKIVITVTKEMIAATTPTKEAFNVVLDSLGNHLIGSER